MKKLLLVGLAGTAALCLAACSLGPASTDAGSGSSSGSISIKVGDNWANSHPMAAAIDSVFKTQIEEKTGGKIKVETFHSGSLGNEGDLWSGVRNGTIEVVVVGTPMNQEFPHMLISDWPWLYRDVNHAKKVWTGEIADEMNKAFNEKFPETQMLAWGPNSARTFTSSKKLTSPDDFKGQKFRMPGNPIHVGLAENLGASAQVIPLGELFSALETGVVDGQDNGMVTVRSEGLYEVQKYVYETNHIVATLEVIVNSDFMKKLSADEQKIVAEAAKATAEKAWDDYIASIDSDRKFLQDKGLTVTPVSASDREVLIEGTKPTVDKLFADNSWAKELTDKIKAVK